MAANRQDELPSASPIHFRPRSTDTPGANVTPQPKALEIRPARVQWSAAGPPHASVLVLLATALTALALLAFAPAASADLTIGAPGSGAGQYSNPSGLAVDPSAELLYVADRGNNRIDVFETDGTFLRAFGWGVADGAAELQTCTVTCLEGLEGGGAGEFSKELKIGVDPSSHDLFVYSDLRIQRFSFDDNGTPADPTDDSAIFDRAWGAGVITAGAQGTGDLSAGSPTIANVHTTFRSFRLGQTITGSGIPSDTKIVALGDGTITLSKPATATTSGVAITVPEGAGNAPVNQIFTLTIKSNGDPFNEPIFWFRFRTLNPSPGFSETKEFHLSDSAATIQASLEALPNLGTGNVAVSGPAGGPFAIEFRGAFADTYFERNAQPAESEVPGVELASAFANTSMTSTQVGHGAFQVCTLAVDCAAGVEGTGGGQFELESQPLAIGPGGIVYVAGGTQESAMRVQEFESSGALLKELKPIKRAVCEGSVVKEESPIVGLPGSMGVDPAGNILLADVGGALRKYDPAGSLLEPCAPLEYTEKGIAFDPVGNLFEALTSSVRLPGVNAPIADDYVLEYESSLTPLRAIYTAQENGALRSVAPYHDASGEVFVVEESHFGSGQSGIVHVSFPAPGPHVLRPTAATAATPVRSTHATLNASANPEGKATTAHFQYITQGDFLANGNSFAGIHPASTTAAAPLGSDFRPHLLETAITGLAPETTYRFRAVATNADGTDTGPEATFTTLAPLEIEATWSTDVGSDDARLHAEVNPLGTAATGYFEYVKADACLEDEQNAGPGHCFDHATQLPDVADGAGPIDFGAGEEPLAAARILQNLAPGTEYRYRVAVHDHCKPDQTVTCTFSGPQKTLRTFPTAAAANTECPNQAFRTAASATLPDCRAYEMVSPLDKNNGDVVGIEVSGAPAQSAPEGDSFAFAARNAFAEPESAPFFSQYLAARDPEAGWKSRSLNAPRSANSLYIGGNPSLNPRYPFFTPDLCSSWLWQNTDVTLSAGAPAGFPALYRRDNCGIGEGSYELLSGTAAPPGFNPSAEVHNSNFVTVIQGFSADGSVSVFSADASLTPDTSTDPGIYQVYASSEGQLHLISFLPPKSGVAKAAVTHSSAGTTDVGLFYPSSLEASVYHAVSADGSRVFWTATSATGGDPFIGASKPGDIYLRVNALQPPSAATGKKCTEPTKGCTYDVSRLVTSSPARFIAADPTAGRAIFSAEAEPGIAEDGSDLYEFTATEEEGGALKTQSTLIAHRLIAVMGTSEDARRVYFASTEALSGPQANSFGAHAEPGKPNLYLYEAGSGFTFIATLSKLDALNGQRSGTPQSPINVLPYKRNSRVSPDGLHAAFTSDAAPTGYDSTDTQSGEPDAEVYLYQAAPGGAGELVCASCNPSGERPTGRAVASVNNGTAERWAAARLPGWTDELYPGRELSLDGKRLFFESFDSLSLLDTNGRQDVYQWEAPGTGDCSEVDNSFSVANHGCVSLVSSGQSSEDSELLDASESGRDVFFTTTAGLLPQDIGLADVYDARSDGGFPAPQTPPAQCEGEACQGSSESPHDPTPASAAFQGAGNVQETHPPRCSRGKVRRKGRCIAKGHKKHTGHKRRH
jgi:hypothetical protein